MAGSYTASSLCHSFYQQNSLNYQTNQRKERQLALHMGLCCNILSSILQYQALLLRENTNNSKDKLMLVVDFCWLATQIHLAALNLLALILFCQKVSTCLSKLNHFFLFEYVPYLLMTLKIFLPEKPQTQHLNMFFSTLTESFFFLCSHFGQ